MFDRWLLRATMWSRRPPSTKRVIFVFALIIFALMIFGIEKIWGWPEWLTVNGRAPRRISQ